MRSSVERRPGFGPRADPRPPTLRSPGAQRALEHDGYAVLRGAARRRLAWLRSMYGQLGVDLGVRGPVADTDPLPTSWQEARAPGPLFRTAVNDAAPGELARFFARMAPFWDELAVRHFHDQRIVACSVLTKSRGDRSVVPLHQDPNVVDERRFRSVTVWIPLEDVSERRGNGTMHVLVGSHRFADRLRGIGISPSFGGDMAALWERTRAVDARAGDVLVLDNRLIHGTPPNTTATERPAVAALAVPAESALTLLTAGEDGGIDVRHIEDEWYRRTSMRGLHEHPPVDLPVVSRLAAPDRDEERRRLIDATAPTSRQRRPLRGWRRAGEHVRL